MMKFIDSLRILPENRFLRYQHYVLSKLPWHLLPLAWPLVWVAGVCLPSPLPPVEGIAGVCPHLLHVILVAIFHSPPRSSLLPSAHLQCLHSLPHIGLVSSLYMLKPPQSSSLSFSCNGATFIISLTWSFPTLSFLVSPKLHLSIRHC